MSVGTCFLFLGINFTRRALALDIANIIFGHAKPHKMLDRLYATTTTHLHHDLAESTLYCHRQAQNILWNSISFLSQ